jgi:hypothetical protein
LGDTDLAKTNMKTKTKRKSKKAAPKKKYYFGGIQRKYIHALTVFANQMMFAPAVI